MKVSRKGPKSFKFDQAAVSQISEGNGSKIIEGSRKTSGNGRVLKFDVQVEEEKPSPYEAIRNDGSSKTAREEPSGDVCIKEVSSPGFMA